MAVPAYNEEALIGETHTRKGLYPSAGVKTLAWHFCLTGKVCRSRTSEMVILRSHLRAGWDGCRERLLRRI